MTQEPPQTLEVPFASLVELAVEWWRLERWSEAANEDGAAAHARHVARRLAKFLEGRELSVVDVTGRRYEPGLAVEVLDVITDEKLPEGAGVIDETVAPVVTWRGAVVRYGQVVVRRRA